MTHPTDDPYSALKVLGADAYRKAAELWVPPAGALDKAPPARVLVEEASKVVNKEVRALFAAGDTDFVFDRFSEDLGWAIDKLIAKQSKSLLNRIAKGQMPFTELFNGLIIPLGEGSRPFFQDLDTTQFVVWDDQEFKSANRHMQRYAVKKEMIWMPSFKPVSQYGITAGEAMRRGLIDFPKP